MQELQRLSGVDDPQINDDGEVHFLQEKPVLLSIVYPPKDNVKKLPAVVCVTYRTTNPKCFHCKGRNRCLHVNIYQAKCSEVLTSTNQMFLNTEKVKVTQAKDVDISAVLVRNQLEKEEADPQHNPFLLTGRASNVFNIRIYYPPSKEDKTENNRINQLKTLFPSGIMTPSVKKGACCNCGNLWIQKPKVSDCESHDVHIHHSKSTADSRNGTLFLLYLIF